MNTVAGSTSPTPSKAPKDSAQSSVQKGRTPCLSDLVFCVWRNKNPWKSFNDASPPYNRYNVGCTKRMGLFRPERSKPANRWRRKSQGRSAIEAKKQVTDPSPSPPPSSRLLAFNELWRHFHRRLITSPPSLKGMLSARRPVNVDWIAVGKTRSIRGDFLPRAHVKQAPEASGFVGEFYDLS